MMQKAGRAVLLFAPIVLVVFCNFPAEPDLDLLCPSQMKLISGGTFSMGTLEVKDYGAQPPHTVTVSSFYMDSSEVTQADFWEHMQRNPSYMATPTNPVESVTWFDAVLYCNARSKRDHRYDTVYSYSSASFSTTSSGIICSTLTDLTIDLSKKGFRLPTEAEWEYACRAGNPGQCFWGTQKSQDTVDLYAWYGYNSQKRPQPVAGKLPNPWGLYDMIGNVQEWCNDWFRSGYSPEPVVNPEGPFDTTVTRRAVRGGSYDQNNTTGSLARSATRNSQFPYRYSNGIGFRCVLRLK